ncbi:MAG: hypothetical protein K2Q15_11165, partial [Burkholderiales bacterium]|nr:hypothetical protein [Burkholderiales bacterium]
MSEINQIKYAQALNAVSSPKNIAIQQGKSEGPMAKGTLAQPKQLVVLHKTLLERFIGMILKFLGLKFSPSAESVQLGLQLTPILYKNALTQTEKEAQVDELLEFCEANSS